MIDSHIVNWARGEFNQEAIRDAIALANDHLGRDIIAALKLGDISFIGANIHWLEGLLTYRDMSEDLVLEYLTAYKEAAERLLPDLGRPIVDWLADYIHNSTKDGD